MSKTRRGEGGGVQVYSPTILLLTFCADIHKEHKARLSCHRLSGRAVSLFSHSLCDVIIRELHKCRRMGSPSPLTPSPPPPFSSSPIRINCLICHDTFCDHPHARSEKRLEETSQTKSQGVHAPLLSESGRGR